MVKYLNVFNILEDLIIINRLSTVNGIKTLLLKNDVL